MTDQNWRPRTLTIVPVLVLWLVHGSVYLGRQRVEDSQTAHFPRQTCLCRMLESWQNAFHFDQLMLVAPGEVYGEGLVQTPSLLFQIHLGGSANRGVLVVQNSFRCIRLFVVDHPRC